MGSFYLFIVSWIRSLYIVIISFSLQAWPLTMATSTQHRQKQIQTLRTKVPGLSWTRKHEPSFCFSHIASHKLLMSLHAGHVLVDSAAGHPTCGGTYFAVLEHGLNAFGIKSVVIPFEKATIPIKARGVGGSALAKSVRFVPLRLGNASVFVEILILKNDVPPLLAVTLL